MWDQDPKTVIKAKSREQQATQQAIVNLQKEIYLLLTDNKRRSSIHLVIQMRPLNPLYQQPFQKEVLFLFIIQECTAKSPSKTAWWGVGCYSKSLSLANWIHRKASKNMSRSRRPCRGISGSGWNRLKLWVISICRGSVVRGIRLSVRDVVGKRSLGR